MKIVHYEKGVTYSDWEREMMAKKIGRITRYCRRLTDEASVITVESVRRETKKKRDSVKVTVMVTLPHQTLRAESRKFEVLEAIDRCTEKLERQIEFYKEKHSSKRQRVG